jgi:hypothetical protein
MLVGLFLLVGALPLAAQDAPATDAQAPAANANAEKTSGGGYYFQTARIICVYPAEEGYVVDYGVGLNSTHRVYIPMSWTQMQPGQTSQVKCEVVELKNNKELPSMSVFFKDGKFVYVKLYLRTNRSDQSWGTNSAMANMQQYFDKTQKDGYIKIFGK